MGNSKSKSAHQIGDDVMNNKSKSASDFNSLPSFQLPNFLKEHKNNIEVMKSTNFDVSFFKVVFPTNTNLLVLSLFN